MSCDNLVSIHYYLYYAHILFTFRTSFETRLPTLLYQLSQKLLSAESLSEPQPESRTKAALTKTLAKGAASTETQTLILESTAETEEVGSKTTAATVSRAQGLAKTQALVASHHMGVNTVTQRLGAKFR
jgi:hypothetical protein